MEFLSQTYVALRGPTGVPQTPTDTISRLSDRLSPSTLLADRRAAVLALKGLSRDCRQEVGERALSGLLEVLYNDAEIDGDIGKAVTETLAVLCDAEDATPGSRELGFKFTDVVLSSERTAHTLFALLANLDFYSRYSTLQFLTMLLHNRRSTVQSHFLTAPTGPASIITVLEDKREIVRNEVINMVQALVSQSPDVQKILAFEGGFEKLFDIVTHEGGVDGGAVAQGALTCVDILLRFNSSNQSYFRGTSIPPILFSLLRFPISLALHQPAPQEFALQFWDEPKRLNSSLVIGIVGILLGSKGHAPDDDLPYTRCLVEIALASNAPTSLKTQALRLLPTNINFPLSEIIITPYLPVLETNGEEWDRLESSSALDVLMELVIHGEYNGIDAGKRMKETLELRAAATTVFENYVRKEEVRLAILRTMLPPGDSEHSSRPMPLVDSLATSPNTTGTLHPADVTSTHLATILFSHLLRGSSRAKAMACQIMPAPIPATADESEFFVPADGAPPAPIPTKEPEDEDERQTLLQVLTENLSLALLSRSRANLSVRDAREWDRYVVGYLCLLSQWLWEDPKSVRGFLDAGGLGVLVEPINQMSESASLVPGLCAFMLGICYEFNRQPGEITRHSIYPIINRLNVDNLVGNMVRLREEERFKAVGPDVMVFPYPSAAAIMKGPHTGEAEVWFDWAFIDFWKSNYYSIQRAFSTEPDNLSSSTGQSAEAQMLIVSLRDVIRQQSEEIESLQKRLKVVKIPTAEQTSQQAELEKKVELLQVQLSSSEEKRKEVEKEQEDLLVLLDEVTSKRRRDKARLQEAGLDISEDEGDGDDDDHEDD